MTKAKHSKPLKAENFVIPAEKLRDAKAGDVIELDDGRKIYVKVFPHYNRAPKANITYTVKYK